MAVDEALLEAALEEGFCAVRWYRWDAPTLSLGYFQATDPDPRFAELAKVRRLSGGGAILHHHEWTYSCVLPPSHPLAERPLDLYEKIHAAVVRALAEFNVDSTMRGEKLDAREAEFLCFSRGDPRDVVCRGHKILGSAQRRRRGAVLQHGSLILRHSEHAPHIPGIADLVGRSLPEDELLIALREQVRAVFPSGLEDTELPPHIAERARVLDETKYRSLRWDRAVHNG